MVTTLVITLVTMVAHFAHARFVRDREEVRQRVKRDLGSKDNAITPIRGDFIVRLSS